MHPSPEAVDLSTPSSRPRVVIVGGGLTGLVAARQLAATCQVTVLEASDRVGGQLEAIEAPRRGGGTVRVDVGAESMHLGAPHVAALVRELGLADEVVGARPGTSALLSRGRLVPLPAGVGPAGPTQVWPVVKSGVMSTRGLLRAGLEPIKARRRITGNISVGAFIGHRFGVEVVERFVEPLLGNLHSGNVHGLGVAETAPQLVPVVTQGRSLLLQALRTSWRKRSRLRGPHAGAAGDRPTASALPLFASLPGGLTTLVDALVSGAGFTVRTNTPATALERDGDGWLVRSGDEVFPADQVVLATPAGVTHDLTRTLCREVGLAMAWVRRASVATVVLGYDRADAATNDVLTRYNGLMLSPAQTITAKAMTNLGRKWPTLDEAEHHLVRVSVGRSTHQLATSLSDEELVARCTSELAALTGLTAHPSFSAVVRYPQGMPQLGPGHLGRIARARASLADAAPGVHLAGSAVDGLGIGSTVKAGRAVADEVLAFARMTA
ncbi:protoporphyrinogen oxidase [Aestuariimicrobium sp. T2.26MG-19.2B]|uniref:protoporphyrinogen oxidase n=1 Tax=Aestuariimicrobium sp. T2.26MG-19.2B TaxID=3040679 RepID=UPI00247793BD|nr:protoporphyrinogen oxidase [Aestuariimicrobium sp. T2.26MG-19.2B]CAI9402618.1 Protoporphyrinogen oxidase [Aestuariimicrobium sp. T2.26MG-19.2B]